MMTNHRDASSRGRRGVTLQAVLGAMFLIEVGLVSLLTLFPIEMMDMEQAIRDCRDPKLAGLADEVVYVTDDILVTSEIAFEDLALGDTSSASTLSKRFAIHDQQLTALIESLEQRQPNLNKGDRAVAQQSAQIISEWRDVVREMMWSYHVLTKADRQFVK